MRASLAGSGSEDSELGQEGAQPCRHLALAQLKPVGALLLILRLGLRQRSEPHWLVTGITDSSCTEVPREHYMIMIFRRFASSLSHRRWSCATTWPGLMLLLRVILSARLALESDSTSNQTG